MGNISIKTVSEYINKVSSLTHEFKNDNKIVVYRGENQDYGQTSCVPNIYRKNVLNNNARFEKNLFDEMSANGLSIGENYLEKAISAQHDGFPSRLLDVSYNCLIALYFACTPYYRYNENINDDKIGKVFIFAIEKMFCPTGENIVNNYNEIIDGKGNSFIKYQLFAKNHKLIDHIRTNKRIIAQQGAFILFQGDEYESIPSRLCKEITIDCDAKSTIRRELSSLFGIDTGSVYPSAENYVDKMVERSSFVDNSEFSFENELEMIIYNLEKDIDKCIEDIIKSKKKIEINKIVVMFENLMKDYYIGIKNIKKNYVQKNHENSKIQSVFDRFINKYNSIINDEFEYINRLIDKTDISVNSCDVIVE